MRRSSSLPMTGLALFAALAVTAAFAAPPKKKPAPAKPDPVAGKKIYTATGCAGCHKIKDEGGTTGPDLTKYASDKKKDAKWTAVQIQDPKKHNPNSAMPPYADKVKGKNLDNLVAYLLTLK
ncbi:MAG TPA: c-type cytochrome [Chthonomonadaceae bacterium]|nr:c-type cytochrome [Chthonomonadaceae bacterium]